MAKIKDTDYLAISARVRAMETTLLTAERMERLLEARSDEEVSKLLQDCGYPELDAARPEEMDAALSQAREELLADLSDSAPDPRYIDIFKLKYDYHNAKAILKAAAVGTSPERMTSPKILPGPTLGSWSASPTMMMRQLQRSAAMSA